MGFLDIARVIVELVGIASAIVVVTWFFVLFSRGFDR